MTQIGYAWQQLVTLVGSLISSLTWRNALDVAVVAVIIYWLLKMIRQTRADSVLKGTVTVLVATWLSDLLGLSALNWLLQQVINTGVIVLVVLFQPELRRALEQLGRSGSYISSKRREDADHDAKELTQALTNLSRRRVGALIVVEQKTGMQDIVASGTVLDAEISAPLIENIFEPNTPLHDGAVVIRAGRIVAAACFLPLSENASISRELGTRHRAALGISETTDAVVLIASEETGILSVAREGKLTRYLDAKTLGSLLKGVFSPEPTGAAGLPRMLMSRRKEKRNERDA